MLWEKQQLDSIHLEISRRKSRLDSHHRKRLQRWRICLQMGHMSHFIYKCNRPRNQIGSYGNPAISCGNHASGVTCRREFPSDIQLVLCMGFHWWGRPLLYFLPPLSTLNVLIDEKWYSNLGKRYRFGDIFVRVRIKFAYAEQSNDIRIKTW